MSTPPPAKYRVLQELGSGGMGTIYKGLLIGHADFQRPVVIKQMRDSSDPQHLRLFVDEARRYAVLDHENIGRIFDFEKVDRELCIILEYIDGWSLVEYIQRHREVSKLPDVDLSVFIISRVCRALQYVFEKAAIVHRDISPSNIMMTREGTVKLIDFGIATRSGTRDRSLSGKPAYMAPEMVSELRADNRSDLFSLGAVLFEMLTAERLFTGSTTAEVLEQVVAGVHPSPRTFNPAIPDAVMSILRRALQRDPNRRYPSAAAMGESCEHYLYDKGYGPTNLTLKQYVGALFPGIGVPAEDLEELQDFPVIEPTMMPVSDGLPPERSGSRTVVAIPRHKPTGQTQPPLDDDGPTLPPGTLAPRPRDPKPGT